MVDKVLQGRLVQEKTLLIVSVVENDVLNTPVFESFGLELLVHGFDVGFVEDVGYGFVRKDV